MPINLLNLLNLLNFLNLLVKQQTAFLSTFTPTTSIMENITTSIKECFQQYSSQPVKQIEKIPQSGSDRIYFRIYCENNKSLPLTAITSEKTTPSSISANISKIFRHRFRKCWL